jgi:hypothetical protein
MVVPAVRLQIREARSAIQEAGIRKAIERCRLLMDRTELALSQAQPERSVDIAPIALGAPELSTCLENVLG